MKTINLRKGFTLIELLIVITIIGVLAVAFLPSILGAPAKARDVARKGHLNQISTAIEAYGLDGNSYPSATNGTAITMCIKTGGDSNPFDNVVKYIQGGVIPKDPAGTDMDAINSINCGAGEYAYIKLNSALAPTQNYALVAQVENSSEGNMATPPLHNQTSIPLADSGKYYVLIK